MGACISAPSTVAAEAGVGAGGGEKNVPLDKNRGGASTKLAQVAAVDQNQNEGDAKSINENKVSNAESNGQSIPKKCSVAAPMGPSTLSTNSSTPRRERSSSQDDSLADFSVDSNSSHSANGGQNNNFITSGSSADSRSSSLRRRRLLQLSHHDSKVGLTEIICGELKNPNLVRIEVPLGKPIEEVYEGVHDGPVLGSGISGVVTLVKHRATGVSYACKCLDLALIDSDEGLRQLKEEIYIMCQLDHPNIVRLEEVYESHSEIYLVQEVCKGGELFDRLDEQPEYHYTEAQCARLVKQMLRAVRYIHNKGIIHRDLKLENFLFSEMEAVSELKMIDFGLSKHFTFGEVHHDAVGTPYTVAPEVIRGCYDERCDVWAVGVITYLLLSGEPPFGGCGGPETLMQLRDNILRGAFEFEPADIWAGVSKEAKEFIKSLLVIDPMERPTAKQAKESKWLKMWSERENNGNGEDKTINPLVVNALVGFKEYSDLRKLLCEVLSFTLLPEQIQGLRQEFEKYDQEGTGEITLSTLKQVLIGNASTGSLGGLTEEEVVDIFNAMRVRKGETSIHWHDFIAAGLSQCQVDDRNLHLAFERLDQEHKGYITFANVMDLMGDDAFENEDQMLKIWGDSMKDVNCKTALIHYEDFVLLMKGQKRDQDGRFMRKSLDSLPAVAEEILSEEEGDHTVFIKNESPLAPPLDATGKVAVRKPALVPKKVSPELSTGSPAGNLSFETRSPPSIGIGKSESGRVSFNEKYEVLEMPADLDFTPPATPVRGPSDYATPTAHRATLNPQLISHLSPPDLSLPGLPGLGELQTSLARGRSVSMDETRGRSVSVDEIDLPHPQKERTETRPMLFKRDSRRAMAIPEHTHTLSDIDKVIEDKSKTPLVVNRKLYRAHREFRRAVTEACKRFEDEQMRRAKETLEAQENASAMHTAGLVMRHGQALSEQSIKNFLKKTLEEQQRQINVATRRGGRGRGSRKKTISDMSGMMGAPTSPKAALGEKKTTAKTEQESLETVKENENLLRNPTKPGEFRKTNYQPFPKKCMFEKGACASSRPLPGISPPPALA